MWKDLSMQQRADLMDIFLGHGVTSLDEMQNYYDNQFKNGGKKESSKWTMQDESEYREWRNSLPSNLRDTDDNLYDMRGAYKAGMQPTLESDGYYHLGSRDPETGRILKSPTHPTYLKALMEDARLGYYPITDSKGNTYTSTWKGNRFANGGHLFRKGGSKSNMQNPYITFTGYTPEFNQETGKWETTVERTIPEIVVKGKRLVKGESKPVNIQYDRPQTFAGRIAQVSGASPMSVRGADVASSAAQMSPYGYLVAAMDLGYDLNRAWHREEGAINDAGLDLASMMPMVSKLGLKKARAKNWFDSLKNYYDEALQPIMKSFNKGIGVAKAADFVDDSWGANLTSDNPITQGIKANGGHIYSGEDEDTQQMARPNIFQRPDGTYFYSVDGTETDVTPITTIGEDPAYWTYTDAAGKTYRPTQSPEANYTLTEAEDTNPLLREANNYVKELEWRAKNNPSSIALQGKYTMPLVLSPVLGKGIATALANPYVDAGLTSYFGAEGLQDLANGNADWQTALEISPVGRIVKPLWNAGKEVGPALSDAVTNGGFAVSTPYLGDWAAKKGAGRFTAWIPTNRNPFKGISWMATGKPTVEGISAAGKPTYNGLPIEMIRSRYPGEGTKLYDEGIKLAQEQGYEGLLVGDHLLSAPKSYSTFEHHYPDRTFLDNFGLWENKNMVSDPKQRAQQVYSLDDFLSVTRNNPEQKVTFAGAPRYRLETPSNARTPIEDLVETPQLNLGNGTLPPGTSEEELAAIEKGRNTLLDWINSPFYRSRLEEESLYRVADDVVEDANKLVREVPVEVKDRSLIIDSANGSTSPRPLVKKTLPDGTRVIDFNTGLDVSVASDLGEAADDVTLHELLHYMTANSKGTPVSKAGEKIINNGWFEPADIDYSGIGIVHKGRSKGWQNSIIDQNDSLLPQRDLAAQMVMERPDEAKAALVKMGKTEEEASNLVNSLKARYSYWYDIQEQRAHLQELFLSKIRPHLKNPNDAAEIEEFLTQNPDILEKSSPYKHIQEVRPGTLKEYSKYFASALGTIPFILAAENNE